MGHRRDTCARNAGTCSGDRSRSWKATYAAWNMPKIATHGNSSPPGPLNLAQGGSRRNVCSSSLELPSRRAAPALGAGLGFRVQVKGFVTRPHVKGLVTS